MISAYAEHLSSGVATAVNLKSLKVFCDVVGRRSFSRAAADNCMTQSGASQIVNHLEQYLGVKLIDRSKRPLVLTAEGEVYYRGCRDLVRRLLALEEQVRLLHEDVAGRVSVASIYSAGLTHMNQCVQQFLERHPKSNVHVEYQHPLRVYELVESGQVDFGLVSYPRESRAVKATAWRREPMRLVCAPQHQLADRSEVAVDELDGLDMVGFDEGLQIRRELDRFFSGHEITVRMAMEFDNIETLKRAVEINAGFSLLPEPTVVREEQLGTLVSIPLSGVELVRPLGILQRCGVELGPTARRFLELLLEQASWEPASTGVV
jgi:DNA-binding transcriptional LysR family regulator